MSWRIIITDTLLSSLWHKLNNFITVYVDVQSTLEQSGWQDVFKYQISNCYFEFLSFWWSTIVRFQPIKFVKQNWVFSLESFNCTTLGLLISFVKVAENAEMMKDFCLLLQLLLMTHEKLVCKSEQVLRDFVKSSVYHICHTFTLSL